MDLLDKLLIKLNSMNGDTVITVDLLSKLLEEIREELYDESNRDSRNEAGL